LLVAAVLVREASCPEALPIWPLQPCCEQVDELGDGALIEVAQGSVFRHLDDPHPGIRQEGAEQFPAFGEAQAVGVRK
jgi:hypothetical protein